MPVSVLRGCTSCMAAEHRAYHPGPLPAQALHSACGSDSRCSRPFLLGPDIRILFQPHRCSHRCSHADGPVCTCKILTRWPHRVHTCTSTRLLCRDTPTPHQTPPTRHSPCPGGHSCSSRTQQIKQPPCLRATFGQCQSPQCALSIPPSCPGCCLLPLLLPEPWLH